MSESPPKRMAPQLDDSNRHFWTGGADGELRLTRCRACGHYLHPPAPVCPECLGRELDVTAMSGRGTLASFTINHQPWLPGFPPPYLIALVELDEQPALRLTSNLVHCGEQDARIGMRVRVCFEEQDGIWYPLFEPEQMA